MLKLALALLGATLIFHTASSNTDSDRPAASGHVENGNPGAALDDPQPGDENGRRLIDSSWSFNPWTGEPIARPAAPPDRTPVEVLQAFFDGYRRRDRAAIAESLALDRILGDIVHHGIDRAEGLTPTVRKVLKERMVAEATRRLAPLVLDILTGPEMMAEFPPPERKDIAMIDRLYRLEIIGDTARLIPGAGMIRGADIVELERVDGRWKITRLPGIMGSR